MCNTVPVPCIWGFCFQVHKSLVKRVLMERGVHSLQDRCHRPHLSIYHVYVFLVKAELALKSENGL